MAYTGGAKLEAQIGYKVIVVIAVAYKPLILR